MQLQVDGKCLGHLNTHAQCRVTVGMLLNSARWTKATQAQD